MLFFLFFYYDSKLDLESGNDKIESICKTIEEFILQIDQKNVNN